MARLLVFNALISSERAAHWPADFIDKDAWPPNNPDLNPLDYHVWGWILDKFIRLNPQLKNILELNTALLMKLDKKLPQETIRKSIVSFRKRLRACINAKGGHFEYKLQNSLVNLVVDVFVFND